MKVLINMILSSLICYTALISQINCFGEGSIVGQLNPFPLVTARSLDRKRDGNFNNALHLLMITWKLVNDTIIIASCQRLKIYPPFVACFP